MVSSFSDCFLTLGSTSLPVDPAQASTNTVIPHRGIYYTGDGFGSGNGLLDPSSAMTPSHQVIFQYLCVTGKIRIIRTNSSETKGLAESYPCLTMARVAAGGVEVLMSVCGFREKISGY